MTNTVLSYDHEKASFQILNSPWAIKVMVKDIQGLHSQRDRNFNRESDGLRERKRETETDPKTFQEFLCRFIFLKYYLVLEQIIK